MCTGRIDMSFIFRALSDGADGVFVGGCRLNECNYTTHGNYHALNMVRLSQRIMEYSGINPERLRIEFMSSGEGNLFAVFVNDFVKKIKDLGPLGTNEGLEEAEIKSRMTEVKRLIPYIKIAKKEKMSHRLKSPEEYETLYTLDEIEHLFKDAISYYIDPQKCQACMICARKCPMEAIEGGKNLVHVIDQEKCIKCGTCYESCPPRFGAIRKIAAGEPVPPPLPKDARAITR